MASPLTMISKLPRWVWIGGWVLAFIAGMVNVVGLLGFEHLGVSHLTASTSRIGVAWVDGDYRGALQLLGLVLSFIAGAVSSGAIVRDPALRLGRRYGVVLLIESALLCAAALFLQRDRLVGVYFAACACGLQNGMASTYSGAILRTTHMTGTLTDVGVMLGQCLDGRPIDRRRLRLYLLVILGFLAGGMTGTLTYRALGSHASLTLLVPAALTGAAAIAYSGFRARARLRLIELRRRHAAAAAA